MEIDQTLVSNLLSLTLIVVTIVYVVFTGRMASDNRKMLQAVSEQHLETIRPYVVVRLGIHEGVIFSLEVENTGRTAARNLKLSLDQDFHAFGEGESIKNYNLFKQGVQLFAPSEKIVFLLSQSFNMDNHKDGKNLTPETFQVRVSYRDRVREYQYTFEVDVRPYYASVGLKSTSEHLKLISEQMKRIGDKISAR